MPNHRFRTVSFDLDGTIVDSAGDLAAALNHALAEAGRPAIDLERVRSMIGHGVRVLLRNGLAATGAADDALVERYLPALLDYYEAHICDRTRPFPGVEAAFDALAAQGVALAVCTNKVERMTRLLIDKLGWSDRFDAIVGGDTLAVGKPDPAPLLLAIERAGGGPAVHIGDSIVDLQTARAARVPCVLVSFGISDQPAATLGADTVIDDFAGLIPALGGL